MNAAFGLGTHFKLWPRAASRGFGMPDTRFSLKSKKFRLKKLSTRVSPIVFFLNNTMKIFKFSKKFEICSDSVGWQGRRAVHKLQMSTPTESDCFLKKWEKYKLKLLAV